MTTTLKEKNDKQLIQQPISALFPFLYSSNPFGQRSKSSLLLPAPPFSKLFFKSTMSDHHVAAPLSNNSHDQENVVIHDLELCMFLIKLDAKGTTAAICYLPTTKKNIIETYHIEIPMSYRHLGLGDQLVKACLDWAKESGTLVIPTCAFVKRHLEYIGSQKYDGILYPPSPSTIQQLKNLINSN